MHDNKINWRTYNQLLVDRGRPSTYLSTAIRTQKDDLRKMNKGKIGKPYEYSLVTVISAFALKAVNKCGYREAAGTVSDYLTLNGIKECPDFRTINWRVLQLRKDGIKLMIEESTDDEEDVIDVVIDSTGIKSRKDGEYRSRKYKKVKNWKQVHIVISRKSHKILNIKVTKDHAGDPNQFVPLMEPIVRRRQINCGFGDGGYDSEKNFEFCDNNNIEPIIPVRINSTGQTGKHRRKRVVKQLGVIRKPGKYRQPTEEQKRGNQERWKNESGYHQRSLIESVIGVFKGVFDESVFSKRKDMIEKELLLKAVIYNKFIA